MNLFSSTSKVGRIALIVIMLLSGIPLPSLAQESGGKSLSWRGHPLPECKSFLITEFAFLWRLAENTDSRRSLPQDRWYGAWELGWMRNINPKFALGGTVYAGADNDGARLGLKARGRWWINRVVGLDLSSGILIAGIEEEVENYPGFTSQLGLNFGDWASLVTQVEVIPLEYIEYPPFSTVPEKKSGTETAWYAGLKLGSYPGTIGGIGSVVVAGIVAALFWSSWD
jgi:hypothetical protein